MMEAPRGPDGKIRHTKYVGEKLVRIKTGIENGDIVEITGKKKIGCIVNLKKIIIFILSNLKG